MNYNELQDRLICSDCGHIHRKNYNSSVCTKCDSYTLFFHEPAVKAVLVRGYEDRLLEKISDLIDEKLERASLPIR